jgi:hypothetical protein
MVCASKAMLFLLTCFFQEVVSKQCNAACHHSAVGSQLSGDALLRSANCMLHVMYSTCRQHQWQTICKVGAHVRVSCRKRSHVLQPHWAAVQCRW